MVGKSLEAARRADGLSRAELARRAGVSVPTVRSCEGSRGHISSFLVLVAALGRRLAWPGLEPDEALGTSLARRRKDRRYPQRVAAEMIGVSAPTIIALEKSFSGRVETLERYLGLLRLSPKLVRHDGIERTSTPRRRRAVLLRSGSEQDRVFTPRDLARIIVDRFPLDGVVLDPCRGDGAFFDAFPDHVDRRWCEITAGRDFFDWHAPVDWIVSNPPWSAFRPFLVHAMALADHVVYLCALRHFSSEARLRDIRRAGFGLKEIFTVAKPEGWPRGGLQLAAIHLERSWTGACAWTGEIENIKPGLPAIDPRTLMAAEVLEDTDLDVQSPPLGRASVTS